MMELPVINHEVLLTTIAQAGRRVHGLTNVPQYDLSIQMTDRNLSLQMNGSFGALGIFHIPPIDANQDEKASR
jgi:hypothetical protein